MQRKGKRRMYDRNRDPQRDLVYQAELMCDEGRFFDDINDLRDHVAWLTATKWLQNQGFDYEVVIVKDGRGLRRATCAVDSNRCILSFPRESRTELTVLHEVAHALSGDGHGPWFCSIYLKLVRRFMGQGEAELLRDEFCYLRIKHRLCAPRIPSIPGTI
jgi:putative metallohydrolase (TIGR04338 family)